MKNKTKVYLGIGIFLILAVGTYFFFQTSNSFFPADYTNQQTLSVSQVSSNANSYVYSFSASPYFQNPLSNANGDLRAKSQTLDQTISFTVSLPSDIQLNKPFNAIATIQGTGGYFQPGYGYATSEVGLKFENVTSTCTAVNSGTVTCNVKGIASMQDSSLSGSFSLLNANFNFQSTFLKQGVQCLDNSYCSNGLVCQNTQCIQLVTTYYELTNNQCSSVQKLSSEKLSNDFDTLIECQSKISTTTNQTTPPVNQTLPPQNVEVSKPNVLLIVGIILGITLLIVIILLIFLKGKKRGKTK